jgi:hypothetical protein
MASIFISYRRDDTGDIAGRVYDWLKTGFGKSEVFLDVEKGGGGRWLERIQGEASSCKVMLVLIGKNWLTVQDEAGRPRLSDKNDNVRTECRIGLQKRALMIPTIIDSAQVPKTHELPTDIASLLAYDGAEIRHTRFEDDVDNLIEMIEATVPRSSLSEPSSVRTAGASSLARAFPGLWQVQIMYPAGMVGQGNLLIEPNGNFHAEGMSPFGAFRIDGTWSADAADQVSLRGHQSDGFQTAPYHAVIGFSEIGPHTMVGALNSGERVVWQRLR